LQISWGDAPGCYGSRLWRLIRSAPSTAPSDTPRQKSPDARWLQYSLKLKRGRFRVGLGVGAGMRAWDALYRTPSNTATAYWRQKPTFAGRVRARELALLRIPHAMLSAITPWRFWLAPRPTPRKPRTVKP